MPRNHFSGLELRMSLRVGTQPRSLEITGLLGRGGMGEVYRARASGERSATSAGPAAPVPQHLHPD